MVTNQKQSNLPETPLVAESADPQLYLDHLQKINDVFHDQIRIADQKAAYIFTFLAAFLVSSVEGRAVFTLNRYQTGDVLTIMLSALLAVAVIVSLGTATLVLLPRHRPSSASLYWGGWPAGRKIFLAAHDKGDPDYLFREYLGNADNLAAIIRSKYRHVGLSVRALIVTFVSYVLLLGVGATSP